MRTITSMTLVALVILSAALSPRVSANGQSSLNKNWLATGIITRVDQDVIYILAKDNNIYKINTRSTKFVIEGLPANHPPVFSVGDTARVYGRQIGPTEVKARQVRIFPKVESPPSSVLPPPNQPVEPSPAIPGGSGAGPAETPQGTAPQPVPIGPTEENLWSNRGFISDITFHNKTMTIQTSKGAFVIDVENAPVTDGKSILSFSDLSVGDAVRVYGDFIGLSKIKAERVILLKFRPDMDAQLPARPTAMRGEILNVDYPSFTFRMQTEFGVVNVLVDDDTKITMQGKIMAFMNLQNGSTVKVAGVGAPNAGFVAQDVVIVSVPPR